MDELLNSSLVTIAESIRAGQVKSKDVVTAFLDRIERVNGKLNAVVTPTAELALKHAAKADADLGKGEFHGALHGVPITIKDSLDTIDAITTWGTLGREDFRPGRDATCVERLRGQGAILLGKTNTPEFTLSFQTDNLVFGKTNNPYNPNLTPGGSSGGAAAIISAGASPLDIGTDTGGSIRLPSHFCGIAGIKPTTGRVPCTGNALPSTGLIAPLTQPGPMARYVEDLYYILKIISGPDLLDPHAIEAKLHDPAQVDIDTLRIGYHTDNGIKTPTEDINQTVINVIDLLKDHNLPATEARPTGIEMAGFIITQVFSADCGEMLDVLLEDCRTQTPSPAILENLKRATNELSAVEFAQVLNLWHNFQSSMLGYFQDFDILITPVNASTAIAHGEKEDMGSYTYTSAYNLTGWPAMVIRAGTTKKGLPIGIQILSRPFREDHCLAVAAWLEARLDPFKAPEINAFG
ncbi:MAG: amidase [Gammaproteobacteria bacterium]|jgi:amidase|nr:amidase [Gammaproteobacteria bacterium]|tara:strand:+ start:6124 stop:7518 length:1395 start_codon:yes stop_codon:yes gene_type:complete